MNYYCNTMETATSCIQISSYYVLLAFTLRAAHTKFHSINYNDLSIYKVAQHYDINNRKWVFNA